MSAARLIASIDVASGNTALNKNSGFRSRSIVRGGTGDETLIEAWASHRSFQPKDCSGGDGSDFHKRKRSNETYASVTDPESRLDKKAKGKEAKLC